MIFSEISLALSNFFLYIGKNRYHEITNTSRTAFQKKNSGRLRAGVLGADDGIISTSSLIIGVSAANSAHHNILIAGIAGLVAGAMSMAASEYVSVSAQADAERKNLAPIQAAVSSAISFSVGGSLPLMMFLISPFKHHIFYVSGASLVFLILLGMLAARIGNANIWHSALRVGLGGAFAMAVTAGIGTLFAV